MSEILGLGQRRSPGRWAVRRVTATEYGEPQPRIAALIRGGFPPDAKTRPVDVTEDELREAVSKNLTSTRSDRCSSTSVAQCYRSLACRLQLDESRPQKISCVLLTAHKAISDRPTTGHGAAAYHARGWRKRPVSPADRGPQKCHKQRTNTSKEKAI